MCIIDVVVVIVPLFSFATRAIILFYFISFHVCDCVVEYEHIIFKMFHMTDFVNIATSSSIVLF